MSLRTIALTCLLAANLAAADDRNARISGLVTDPSGAPIAGAAINLHNRENLQVYRGASDATGNCAITVPRGDYLMEASSPGLLLTRSIAVRESQTLSLQLEVRAAAASVTVTAEGTPQSADETSKAVDVVDQSEMDRRGIGMIVDAVRDIPGLRVSQRGGPGGFSSIQIRGLAIYDTSILIDGMRFRDVGKEQADASSFLGDLAAIDTARVEVLRGSGSSLYGSNAVGGVVNVVTDPGGGPFHGALLTEGGGLGEFRGLARFAGGAFDDRLHYSAGFGHLNVTRGIDGDDRYRNTSGHGLIDYSFRPGMLLSGRLLATDAFTQLNQSPTLSSAGVFIPALDDPDKYQTSRFLSAMVAWQHQVSAPLSYRISYQALLSDRNDVEGPLGPGFQPTFRTSDQFNGRIDTLQARANLSAGPHNLFTAGYEFERQYFDQPSYTVGVTSDTQVAERSNSFDVQDQVRLFHDRLQISLSGRAQIFELTPPRFSGTFPVYAGASALSPPAAYTGDGSIAYFFRRTGTKIRSHVGNGYREPSLFERFGTSFFAGAFSAYGDPRLRPERSLAVDAGIDQYFATDRVRLSATYFYTRLQEVIQFNFTGGINPVTDPFGRFEGYLNTRGGIARGVELAAEAKPWRSMTVKTSYTYTNAQDRVSQYNNGVLQTPRIFPHSFTLVMMQQFGKHWDAAFDLLAASRYAYPLRSREFFFSGPRQAGMAVGYTHPINERLRLRLSARVSNVFNQLFYEDGFQTPRRWAVGGVGVLF